MPAGLVGIAAICFHNTTASLRDRYHKAVLGAGSGIAWHSMRNIQNHDMFLGRLGACSFYFQISHIQLASSEGTNRHHA